MRTDPAFRREDPGLPGWKGDFHLHTAEDRRDRVGHSAVALVERAVALGYQTLAITLHDYAPRLQEARARAENLGLLLIPGIELTIEDRHVLALGIEGPEAESIQTIQALRAARKRLGDRLLVIAPHPFYIFGHSMGRRFHEWVDCFDAVEVTRLQTRWIGRNGPAAVAAHQHGLPVVANSDTHHLRHFGRHYTKIESDSPLSREAVFEGIRAGRVTAVCPPLSSIEFFFEMISIFLSPLHRRLGGKWRAAK